LRLLYYLTPHGFGHACRAWAITQELAEDVEVIFRTTLPEEVFREEVKRPFSMAPAEFDCGCIQKDGVTLDKTATLKKYRSIAERNARQIKEEIAWVRQQAIDGIVADIPPFPIEVAKRAQIPSIAVTNFTWHDIYAPFLRDDPSFRPDLDRIREQYAMVDLLLALRPALEMGYFPQKKPMPFVGRKGRSTRSRINEEYGLHPEKHLGLIYTGNFGMDGVAWGELERFSSWEFIGLYPLPGEPKNYHLFRRGKITYPDMVASAKVMISKIGYATVAECLINGTPLVFLPREDFAEYPVLEKEVLDRGYGWKLSPEDYIRLRWDRALEEVLSRKGLPPVDPGGARLCARTIEDFIRGRKIP
jgi:hypothetical protein